MGKGKVYIIHIYFQIANFLKTGVYLYIYQAYINMLIFSHEFVMVYNKIQHIILQFLATSLKENHPKFKRLPNWKA